MNKQNRFRDLLQIEINFFTYTVSLIFFFLRACVKQAAVFYNLHVVTSTQFLLVVEKRNLSSEFLEAVYQMPFLIK